jgi:hypothetical protein
VATLGTTYLNNLKLLEQRKRKIASIENTPDEQIVVKYLLRFLWRYFLCFNVYFAAKVEQEQGSDQPTKRCRPRLGLETVNQSGYRCAHQEI